MRKFFTQMIKVSLLLLVMLAFIQVNAQKMLAPLATGDIQFSIENQVQISDKILQFDLYMLDTDAGQPFEYSLGQAGILISNSVLNGGTLSAAIVAGSTLVAAEQPNSISIATGAPNACIKIASRSLPGCGNGTVISTVAPGTCYCRVQVTNTNAFTACTPANLAFQITTTGVPPFLQTKIYEYQACSSTQVTTTSSNCINNTGNPNLNCGPAVITTAATAITASGATLNGTINANSNTTTSSFDWGTTIAYGTNIPGTPLTVTGTSVTPVSASISGLLPCTQYHFRLKGTYGGSNVATGSDVFFTTLPAAPICVTNAASAVTSFTATFNGTVNHNGICGSSTVTFEYSTDPLFIAPPATVVAGIPGTASGTSVTTITTPVAGLLSNTPYYYRIKAVSTGGTITGSNQTFTTLPSVPPAVTNVAATSVSYTSATVNGTVNANGTSTVVVFEWGTDPLLATFTTTTAIQSPVTGSSVTPVSANLTGLTTGPAGTTYYFRCRGTSLAGTTAGTPILSFTTTPGLAPTVVTNAATALLPTSVTLNGTVTANGLSTAVTFEYSTDLSYNLSVAGTPSPVTGGVATAVSANLTGLIGNTCYHFRCKGVNLVGTGTGGDMTFCTPCPPAGQAGPISGPTQVCQGGTGYVYTVTIPNATGYIWTLPVGGTITSGLNTNSITVSYASNALSGYIFVYGTSTCGNGPPSQLGIAMNAPATPSITGPAAACINVTGNVYTTQPGMTNYAWTISGGTITAGGTNTSNTATVTWTATGAKTISVNYNNANGCAGLAPAVYNVTVNALPVPTITGPTPACTNYPSVYSTQANMTGYVWAVTGGGVITAGQGTKDVTVTWATTGAKTVTVNYVNGSGCTAVAPTVFNVTVNQGAAPTITGATEVCVNSGYITYTTQTGMTGYTWAISGGVINFGQGTNSVLVTWNTAGANWISVTYTNTTGCAPPAPTQLNVLVDPIPGAAGVITGTAVVCGGATGVAYSVATIPNASTYVWTLPAGATIASGANTRSITVNFAGNASPGNITVYGNNVCGNGATSPPYAVAVSALPGAAGTIDGPVAVCSPASGVVYSVAAITGATDYIWTLPAGTSVVSGAGTNSITVDFDVTAVSGVITVTGSNTCGNGTVSPSLNVTVAPTPDIPTISWAGGTLTSSAPTGNQWYFNGAPILGATGQTYVPGPGQDGDYYVVVTINGCSAQSDTISVIIGIEDLNNPTFSIYPIPNDGHFTVSLVSHAKETYTISIYNDLGMKIFEEGNIVVTGTLTKEINLKPIAQGVYSVVLQNGKNRIEKKILVSK